MRSNAFNWILVSLAAKTKALLTGRRREAQTKDGGPSTRTTRQTMARTAPTTPPDGTVSQPDRFSPPLVGPNCANANGSEFKQNQTKTPLHRQQTAAFLHSRASESASNPRKRRKRLISITAGSISSKFVLTDGKKNAVNPAEFFTRCCESHPPPASSGCCCAPFAVRAARERLERAHKWGRGVPRHQSLAVIGWHVAPWS